MTLEEIFTGKFTASKWAALGRYLVRTRIRGGVGIRTQQSVLGTIISAMRSVRGSLGGSTASVCAFGEIITYDLSGVSTTGIRGGLIHCGDQNFEIPNQSLDLTAAGDWLVYISVPTESNRDDDSEIFLPGIKTGTAPAGTWGRETWTLAATYPPNDLPTVATGLGDIILPIGRLTIADGVATLIRAGCGNFRIGQCAGILSYARG